MKVKIDNGCRYLDITKTCNYINGRNVPEYNYTCKKFDRPLTLGIIQCHSCKNYYPEADKKVDNNSTVIESVERGEWRRYYRSGTTVAEGWVSSCCDMWSSRKSSFCPDCGRPMKIEWEY